MARGTEEEEEEMGADKQWWWVKGMLKGSPRLEILRNADPLYWMPTEFHVSLSNDHN